MAFWGVEVKSGRPFTLQTTDATGIKRLHLSQATLGLGIAETRSILQCNIGSKSPLFLCVLFPEKIESCQLNIEFEEADDVIFSVLGARSVHITGYFLGKSTAFSQNDDESESYGEDIGNSDMDKGSSDDYNYSDSFINDDDKSACRSHASSTDDDEVSIKEWKYNKAKNKNRNGKGGRLRNIYEEVSDSESNETSAKPEDSSEGDCLGVRKNEDDLNISTKIPEPSRITRSKARTSSLENDQSDRVIEPSSSVSPSENGDDETPLKKRRKKNKREDETTNVQENLFECLEKNKQALDNKNIDEEAVTTKSLEPEIPSNEVIIEEIAKGKLDGKVAADEKKVSIFFKKVLALVMKGCELVKREGL
uniref:peptidylprolyl isomerase n=2 Tax=Noccaea caerulescens TaxID=107243 RepID=A0A1J3F7A2_NOCCA